MPCQFFGSFLSPASHFFAGHPFKVDPELLGILKSCLIKIQKIVTLKLKIHKIEQIVTSRSVSMFSLITEVHSMFHYFLQHATIIFRAHTK